MCDLYRSHSLLPPASHSKVTNRRTVGLWTTIKLIKAGALQHCTYQCSVLEYQRWMTLTFAVQWRLHFVLLRFTVINGELFRCLGLCWLSSQDLPICVVWWWLGVLWLRKMCSGASHYWPLQHLRRFSSSIDTIVMIKQKSLITQWQWLYLMFIVFYQPIFESVELQPLPISEKRNQSLWNMSIFHSTSFFSNT